MGFVVLLRMIPWSLLCSVGGHALLVYLLSSPGKPVNVMRVSVEQGRTTINMRHSKPKLTKKELDVAKKELPIERDAPKPTPVEHKEIPPPLQQALLEMPVKAPDEEKPIEEPKPIERKVRPPEVLEVAEMEAPAVAESVARNAAVDVLPSKLVNPVPGYPIEAYNARQTGQLMLLVLVGADGRAKEVRVFTSSGVPVLDDTALETVRAKWKFNPARRGSVAVDFEIKVPFEFRFTGGR